MNRLVFPAGEPHKSPAFDVVALLRFVRRAGAL